VQLHSELVLVASVPTLKGCHTQARTFDELIERIKEAIELCLEIENFKFGELLRSISFFWKL
jgi:predicted RNase H-like HicB family nuclease